MDFWVSDLLNGEWTEPKDVKGPFNTPYANHCIYFTEENWEFAYWTSTRPEGFGGNDIWSSEKLDGSWKEAQNLGPNVNSEASEHHSLPSEDGRSLYITSDREGGFGGEDIYVSSLDPDDKWTDLVNLGGNVNSDQSDRCPAFSPDFSLFYFDSERSGGYGNKGIWVLPYSQIENMR